MASRPSARTASSSARIKNYSKASRCDNCSKARDARSISCRAPGFFRREVPVLVQKQRYIRPFFVRSNRRRLIGCLICTMALLTCRFSVVAQKEPSRGKSGAVVELTDPEQPFNDQKPESK